MIAQYKQCERLANGVPNGANGGTLEQSIPCQDLTQYQILGMLRLR